MGFIAYHFHWSSAELLELDHAERRRWVGQISAINRQLDMQPASRSIEAM
jgi:hypothetical protein